MAIMNPIWEDKQLGSEASARQVKYLIEVMKQNNKTLEQENINIDTKLTTLQNDISSIVQSINGEAGV